ncbi:MAG TPA: VWA domain-containing protein [Pyrinomonadaceae bacterium]|nr:VWA domain-containing protein [Pyrinomonadaceae bacterium]HMP65532.1 VWA domain-containing protein [Pyrinomonadaceae bacterium]
MAKAFNRHFQFLGSSKGAKPSGRLRFSNETARTAPWLLLIVFVFAAVTTRSQTIAYVDVAVRNSQGKFLDELSGSEFRLFVNGKQREIKQISMTAEPVSFAVLIDVSSSSFSTPFDSQLVPVNLYRHAVIEFLRHRQDEDEYMLLSFSENPELIMEFDSSAALVSALSEDGPFAKPSGVRGTRLYDAINTAVEHLARSQYRKKVIILMSDTRDHLSSGRSKARADELLEQYQVGVFSVSIEVAESRLGGRVYLPSRMDDVTDRAGGRRFWPNSRAELAEVMARISKWIDSQYRISFELEPADHNRKRSRIEVRLELTSEQRKELGRPLLDYRKHFSLLTDQK